ncbi:uncharacterized protein LOC113213868 [Frankliniella occidentalis]|uniref:Uncharacterized protein LOC113213868 n=1 Tax=Frankliniella occidentalis TaxID=133901 RepID=A0A6J1T6J8_FRAOC|nr:uncharacterized protein LOC113213868 [Frankliniella occidentalis]
MRSALSTLLLLALAVAAAADEDTMGESERNMMRACAAAVAKNLEAPSTSPDNESPQANGNGIIPKKTLKLMMCLFRGYNVFNEDNNGFNQSNFRKFLQIEFPDNSIVEEISDTCSKKVESSGLSDIEERTVLLLNCIVEVERRNKTHSH